MERNVPKLRFKGFNDEWKEKKLSEIANIVGGGTPSTTEKSYWDGNIQWFTPTEIKDAKYVASSMRTITEQGVKNSSAKILPKGSILLTTRATLGEMAILENDATTNQGFQSLIVNKNNNNEFVYYLQEKIKKYCYKNASGSTFLEISKSNLEKFKVNMPSLQEQERIANFLTKVDKIIEKQDEKVKNLEKYKKGMMQKIFSQEIRFKDENGNEYPEWEIKRVEDIANIQVGFTPDTKNDSFWEGDIKWLSIAGMNSKYIFDGNKRISNEALGKRELIPKNTLVMSFKLTIGRLAIIKEPMITNEAICQFYWKDKNIINEYMYQYLDSIRIESFGCRAAKGITLNNESLNSIIVKLPCIDEQNKIADILTNIDCINQEELNKLNELKRWKKGLLQQMFV